MIGIVNNNTIRQTCGAGGGMSITAGDTTASGLGNGPLNATVFNNSVITPSGLGPPTNNDHGIVLIGGNVSGNTNQVCFDVKNNTAQGNTAVGTSGRVLGSASGSASTVFLPGYAGPVTGATAVAAVRLYILARPNTASGDPSTANAGDVSVTVQAPGAFANGGAGCTQPTVPTGLFGRGAPETSAMSMDEEGAGRQSREWTAARQKTSCGPRSVRVQEGMTSEKYRKRNCSAMMPAAIERWRETGISADDLMRLQAVTFEITDLPDGQLATATSTSVKIDETAAGYGWYSDLSPMEDSEFDVPVPGRELQTTEFSRRRSGVWIC